MLATSVAALILASSLTSASPTPQKRSASVIPIRTRQTPKVFDAAHIHQERAHIKAKYGDIPQRIQRAKTWSWSVAEKRSTTPGRVAPVYDVKLHRRAGSGKEALTDQFDQIDEFYYGPLSIGTPAQESSVDFDTGSSDLVLPLASCQGCAGQLFDESKSSTFKKSTTPFTIQYADKSGATGNVATDTVTVAGLTVAEQGFGAVVNETGGFNHGPNAGLLGLGFPANAESKSKPFFINLAEQGGLASNVFSFYMARGGGSGSELCFGCTNSEKFSGDIGYYPLDPSATQGTQLYWNIASSGFAYSGGSADSGNGQGGDETPVQHTKRAGNSFGAVIDSGTTLIYAAPAAAKALYDQIPGAKPAPKELGDGFFTFPCDAKLGEISIGFGYKQYAINPKDFNLGAATQGSSDCVGGIIGEEVGANLAIIGDEFMKNWYSVFDYDNKQVGFAKAN